MVNNSIYTNPSAYTALQNLNKVNRQLEVSQARISSGLKVASATDSTTAFSIAQGIRGEINAETQKNGRERLVITSVPYQVNKSVLNERIDQLV